jgi:plastocyanin
MPNCNHASGRLAAAALLSALLTASPLAAGAAAPAKAVTVTIARFAFTPGVVSVPVGASVTWINNDDDAHSVVADGKAFRSAPLDTGDRYSFTFQAAGTYGYHCGLHPQMVGKIVVTR